MAVRIISACVALPLFLLVIYVFPPICLPVFIAALSVVAVYELLWRSGIVRNRFMAALAYVYAAAIPIGVSFAFESIKTAVFPAMFLFVIAAFAYWLFNQKKITFENLAVTFFAAIIIPLFFSSLVRIFYMENGKLLILIPFIAAWLTDTGAYFTGVFFGRHKLAPEISPKKTVEGSVGGIITAVLSLAVYGAIIGVRTEVLPVLAVCGLVLSVIAQIGDLSMSLVKREHNIKDYGVIFPGHGGILDRFDSVLFTAPATLILLDVFKNIISFSAL